MNGFGGANVFPLKGSTAPLVFSCVGAAVMAIGNGRAGSAPINVVYTSAVGGITAVGSTFITVAPAGAPVVSMSCNPTTLTAGATGSLCTATVTDINGNPLSGLTGASVTFTSSDPHVTVSACAYGISPLTAIRTTLSPIGNPVVSEIPGFNPFQPCQIPSSTAPSQITTFVTGQAVALVTAGANTPPGPVTISATVGMILPPNYLCSVAPFLPIPAPFPNTNSTGAPVVAGCGSAGPVGFGGAAASLSTATSAIVTSGTVTLPNAPSAATTLNVTPSNQIDIVGSTPAHPLVLPAGCDQVIATSSPGAPITSLLNFVDHRENVVSIWRYNNALRGFQSGFFGVQGAPTDISTTGGAGTISPPPSNGLPALATQTTETYWFCVKSIVKIGGGPR